ncbi:MAG: GGDEF domain-containing protein [Aliivibrio sp.]|uniref:GGDEF domain-containing protein n=1 Tax=Aliivibrio sp. TaxID=1872443 RepID=UPI001A3B020E|nr:GGDEF domain-containing protein [Aliivibrio sp.]
MSFSLLNHPTLKLLLPILFSLISILGMDSIISVSADNPDVTYLLPYILFSITIMLSQPFNQGRTGLIAIVMAVAYYFIQSRLQISLSEGTTRIEFTLLAILIPVCLMSVFIYPNRRIISKVGSYFIIMLLLMLVWSLFIIEHFKENDMSWIWQSYLLSAPEISHMPIIVVLYNLILCGASAILILTRSNNTDQAIFSCLLLSSLTFLLFQVQFVSSTFFTLAGVLLILNIMATSHELAFIDQLTNIPGRRALEAEMAQLGRVYTIAMLDIDHFKQFNDIYGHATGDHVLKLVASLMKQTEGNAKVYRYGGEEFTVLFKGKSTDQAKEYLVDLRKQIADYQMIIRNSDDRPKDDDAGQQKRTKGKKESVNVTISIGYADSNESSKPAQVLKKADDALYRAKKAGRNRVSK